MEKEKLRGKFASSKTNNLASLRKLERVEKIKPKSTREIILSQKLVKFKIVSQRENKQKQKLAVYC